ncbi:MAG: MFS transporter [Anaerolineaceae bacterium]|nr:MFS transporter [Anaerolineaceae bacterium]
MEKKERRSFRTMFALGFGYFIDQGEAQAMSVLVTVIQSVFNVSYKQLGLMTTLRNITQSISAPVWGYLADKYSRKKVLLFGTGIWGFWTVAVGFMPNFTGILIVRAISGLGLGCLMPATFSILGDHFRQEKRGKALGFIHAIGLLGTVIGVVALGFVATVDLWQWGFIGLGLFSVVSGLLIWWLVEEPPRGSAEPEIADLITHDSEKKFLINWQDVFKTLSIPTIWAAIIQGVSGSMPWVVMSFYFVNWMVTQLDFKNEIDLVNPTRSAPLVFAVIVIGAAISNYVGGLIGDWAEKKSWKYGRTIIGQISVFSGVPLFYILFTKGTEMSFWGIFGLAFGTALLIGWPGTGAKEPMMQAVVPPELRSSAYSMVTMIESGLAAFSGLITGILADKIGLTKALLWTVPFPWLICTVLFTIFYFTYPKDALKVRQQMADRRDDLLADQTAQ